jgi:F0F1-type ATP synthase assembly protein I
MPAIILLATGMVKGFVSVMKEEMAPAAAKNKHRRATE